MSVFGAAIDIMFADPNFSESVVYTPSGGAPVTIRAIFTSPDQEETFGRQRVVLPSLSAKLRASDVTPAEGDRLTRGGATYAILGAPKREDSRSALWVCGLIEATT